MKKRLLQIAFTSLAFVMYLSVNAQNSGSCGTNATWEFSGSTLTITGTGEITTYSSTQPTDYPWFSLASSIQTVIINEGITNIPDWAFAMYENLRSISLPSTLTSIGNSALEETNLWNVSLPEGLQTIGHYAFMMIPITAICFPSTVTDIGEAAFAYCDDLATIGCYASTPPALYNNTVFDECPKIASVFVQEAKVADYKGASGWSDFGEKIQSPGGYCGPDGTDEDLDNDITKATWTFDMSTRTLTIQGTKMGQYNRPWESAGMGGSGGGFNPDNFGGYPKGIEHVIIGEGITKIPASSFYMEIGIKTVSLPSTLTAIGNDAFGECFNIDSIVCNATTPPTMGSQGSENFVIYGNVDWDHNIPLAIESLKTILVPSTSVNAYKAAAGWSVYADYIKTEGDTPQSTTTTFTYTASEKLTVFDNKSYFTGATAVNTHEFTNGTGTVIFDGTVTAIADRTFYYSSQAQQKMTGINIPASVKTIGTWSFAQCDALVSVTFEESSELTTIDSYAFGECTNLTSITLPDALTTLGGYIEMGGHIYYNGSVFSESGLTSIEIPKNLTTIYGGGHFADCPLTSLTVNAANTKYDSRSGCNAVVETATDKIVIGCWKTTVPDGIKTIGYEAFFGESQEFSLVLPESIDTIEDRAFHWADGLKTINIPSGITVINEETFLSCLGVTDVYCKANPDSLTFDGFDMAFNMTTPKATKFHVIQDYLSKWTTKYPEANVTFVGDIVVGIKDVHKTGNQNNTIYNLGGQRSEGNYRGIIIKNGKKLFIK